MSDTPAGVTVSAFGKWHAFRLAAELHRLGRLSRLYTAYPKRTLLPSAVLSSEALPPSRVSNLRAVGLVHVALGRLGLDGSAWLGERFDRWVARRLSEGPGPRAGVLHAWAGYCLHTLRAARSLGWLACLERSSVHVTLQRELLWEECDRWGLPRSAVSFARYHAMLEEYDAANRIVVPSGFCARSFLERGFPADRLLTVPLGVDTRLFHPPAQPRPPRPFRLLTVAPEPIRKGLRDLLEAWAYLRLSDAELWVVCPVQRDAVPRSLRLRSGEPGASTVRWWRHQTQAELAELYRRSSAFSLPSIEDGFGMVVLEAMACGLPVIVSENVGAKDCVRERTDGFVAPVRDPAALAERVESLYRDPDRARWMGEQAAARAREFPWERYGERMLQSYGAGDPE